VKIFLKVVLLFLSLCVLLGFLLSISQSAKCNLESLLLQDNMMPDNWKRLWRILPPALPKEGAVDALKVVYENGNEIAQHTIYRYKNSLLTFLFLRINNQLFFPSGSWRWSDLAGSEDWGLNDDGGRIRCGDSDDPFLGDLCVAVIRYGPYISEFSSPIEEGVMSHEEFKALVVAIDEQIASCIRSPNHQR
jgi:hypothetical protein